MLVIKMMPIVVRYMTHEEEGQFEGAAGISEETEEPRYIAIKKGYPTKESARVFTHELGHIKFPVDVDEAINTWNWYEYHALNLFRELCADYFALKYRIETSKIKWSIGRSKRLARGLGLTRSMIERLDRVARQRVGYTGKEVKW